MGGAVPAYTDAEPAMRPERQDKMMIRNRFVALLLLMMAATAFATALTVVSVQAEALVH
jgi:small neutral amino acid transporter SnatA (MarC family)